jgi:hypothetical protein
MEKMSFKLGQQNKEFFSSKGTLRIRYSSNSVMLGTKEVSCNESIVKFPTEYIYIYIYIYI